MESIQETTGNFTIKQMKWLTKSALICIGSISLTNCAAPYQGPTPEGQAGRVSLGMSKQEVTSLIGAPTKSSQTVIAGGIIDHWQYTNQQLYYNVLTSNGLPPFAAGLQVGSKKLNDDYWDIRTAMIVLFSNGSVCEVTR